MSTDEFELDCVVVGGGPGGLVAAYRMKQAGLKVHLLECEAAVGGRVKSGQWKDKLWYNAGAQFIAGPDSTATNLVAELGMKMHDFMEGPVTFFDEGEMIVADSFASYGLKLKWPLMAKLDMLYRVWRIDRYAAALNKERASGSMGPVYARLNPMPFSEIIDKAHPRVRKFLAFLVQDICSQEPENLSAVQGIHCVNTLFRNNLEVVDKGNQEFVKELGRRLGDSVQVGAKVDLVRNEEQGVTVSYQVNGERCELKSRYAVVSTPADIVPAIVHDLPIRKQEAIKYVGYGPFVTCVFLTNETEPQIWDRFLSVPVSDSDTLMAFVNQSQPIRKTEQSRSQGSVLMTLAGAEIALKLMELSEDEIRDRTTQEMLRILPQLENNIEEVVVTKWERGISSMKPGAYDKLPELREPFGNIMFCGDYLNEGEARMDPAITSAETAANAIIDILS